MLVENKVRRKEKKEKLAIFKSNVNTKSLDIFNVLQRIMASFWTPPRHSTTLTWLDKFVLVGLNTDLRRARQRLYTMISMLLFFLLNSKVVVLNGSSFCSYLSKL